VVRDALGKTVDWVESVAGIGGRHNPLVVRLVEALVYQRVVQPAMDEVDEQIGKDEEQRELEEVVPPAGTFGGGVVELAIPTHLGDQGREGEQGHDGEGLVRLHDLQIDLVLEELGVLQGLLVEDEDV